MATKRSDKWPVTLKAGLLKGRTVTSQADYNAQLKAEQERTGTPKRVRKPKPGESVEQSVTRALRAIEPKTKAKVAAHRARKPK
jgi:hypothetical protein